MNTTNRIHRHGNIATAVVEGLLNRPGLRRASCFRPQCPQGRT